MADNSLNGGQKALEILRKTKDFITRHANIFCILALLLFGYLFLFLNLGSYRLLDTDETKYVNIARAMLFSGNFTTPHLNFETFLEKPPLFFWLTAFSYKMFGNIDTFASRFPVAIMSLIMMFGTFVFGKKALGSKIYGLVSAMILLSTVLVGLYSHLAITDIGFTALTMGAIYCAVITLFNVKEENKKYLWCASYIFSALAVLQNGLLGLVLPFIVIVLTFIALNKGKELIKPINIVPGVILFFLILLPWCILAYSANGCASMGSVFGLLAGVSSKKSFLFYLPVIFAGLLPWTFSFVSVVIRGIKSLAKDYRATKSFRQIFSNDTNDRKLLIFASIYAISILLFFSIPAAKSPALILPLFPALSLITGYYWWGYITDNKFEKGIKISTVVGAVFFILLGLLGAFALQILPEGSLVYAQNAEGFRMLTASWLIIISLITLLCLISKNRSLLFIANVVLMLGVSIIMTGKILNYAATFGQAELETLADRAQMVSDSKLVTLGFREKYSLLNNSKNKVYFIKKADNEGYGALQEVISTAKKEGVPVYLITKKSVEYAGEFLTDFDRLDSGMKYELYMR